MIIGNDVKCFYLARLVYDFSHTNRPESSVWCVIEGNLHNNNIKKYIQIRCCSMKQSIESQ